MKTVRSINLRMRKRQAGLAALSWLVPAVAIAQTGIEAQTGSRIADRPTKVNPIAASEMMKSVARCVLTNKPDKVAHFLENSDTMQVDFKALGISEAKLGNELGWDKCFNYEVNHAQFLVQIKFQPNGFRTLLQEEAYLDAHRKPPVLADTAVETVSHRFVSEGDLLKQAQGLAAFADCITFKNSSGADALLRTRPRSPEERLSARALAPTLGACLVEGQTISLTAENIRAVVADGLWSRFVYGSKPHA